VTIFYLEDVPSRINEKLSKERSEIELENGKKMAEIRFLHSKILALIKDIKAKELESKENERFNRVAFTAKSQIEIHLLRTLEKIDPKERGRTLNDSKAYCNETLVILINEINHFKKSIVYTSVYLKDEMRQLGETIQNLVNNLQELRNFFEEKKEFFEHEKIIEKVKKIKNQKTELAILEKKLVEVNKKLTEEEKEKIINENKLDLFLNGKESQKLKTLEEEKLSLLNEKQSLKTELSSLLSTIDKPMQRFKQLCESNRWRIQKEEKDILDAFLTNPILALRSDPKGETLKSVLQEIVKAIESNKIEFKDKEKEKKLGALNEILAFDFFEKMFWKMNEIQKKQTQLDKEISSTGVFEQKQKLEKKIEENERKINEIKEENENEKKIIENIKKNISSETDYVSIFVSKLFKKTILINNEEQ